MAQLVLLMWGTSYLLSGYLRSLWCPWLWGFCIWWLSGSFSLLWGGSTTSTWSLPGRRSPGGEKRGDVVSVLKCFHRLVCSKMPRQRNTQVRKLRRLDFVKWCLTTYWHGAAGCCDTSVMLEMAVEWKLLLLPTNVQNARSHTHFKNETPKKYKATK